MSALFVWMTTHCLFRIPTRVFVEAFVQLITAPHRCALYDFIPVAHPPRSWLGLGLATLSLSLSLTLTLARWRTAARPAPSRATRGTMTSSPSSPPTKRYVQYLEPHCIVSLRTPGRQPAGPVV